MIGGERIQDIVLSRVKVLRLLGMGLGLSLLRSLPMLQLARTRHTYSTHPRVLLRLDLALLLMRLWLSRPVLLNTHILRCRVPRC